MTSSLWDWFVAYGPWPLRKIFQLDSSFTIFLPARNSLSLTRSVSSPNCKAVNNAQLFFHHQINILPDVTHERRARPHVATNQWIVLVTTLWQVILKEPLSSRLHVSSIPLSWMVASSINHWSLTPLILILLPREEHVACPSAYSNVQLSLRELSRLNSISLHS